MLIYEITNGNVINELSITNSLRGFQKNTTTTCYNDLFFIQNNSGSEIHLSLLGYNNPNDTTISGSSIDRISCMSKFIRVCQ